MDKVEDARFVFRHIGCRFNRLVRMR
jgi:hypothetical protein